MEELCSFPILQLPSSTSTAHAGHIELALCLCARRLTWLGNTSVCTSTVSAKQSDHVRAHRSGAVLGRVLALKGNAPGLRFPLSKNYATSAVLYGVVVCQLLRNAPMIKVISITSLLYTLIEMHIQMLKPSHTFAEKLRFFPSHRCQIFFTSHT